ncbi:MAG: hypothetical protein Ct9H300mP11_01060 [Chloroflexota bacterium]|nr:MAG: hypothetical protein Ct9H300mP11_01060 [Chloroflexota bacterium]
MTCSSLRHPALVFLEAAIVNTCLRETRGIAATAGAFGTRFVDMVEAYGADVKRMDFEWGGPIDPDDIRKALKDDPSVKAVLVLITRHLRGAPTR